MIGKISSERDRDGVKGRKKERPIEKMGVFLCGFWDVVQKFL